MKLLFSNYLGDCSYSFQGSSNLLALQFQFPCFSSKMQSQEIIPFRHSQEFLVMTVTCTWFNGFQIKIVMILKSGTSLAETTLLGKINLGIVYFEQILKGIFGGSQKITL